MKKIIFKLDNGKKVKIYKLSEKKMSDVSMSWLFHVFIRKDFSAFSHSEQQAIICHELYHNKFFNHLWAIICVLTKNNKALREEEFEADKYAAIMGNKEGLISVFRKAMKRNKCSSLDNLHPSFEARIKKLQKFNVEKYNNKLQYHFTNNLIFECKEGSVEELRKTVHGIYMHSMSWLLVAIILYGLIIGKGDLPFNNIFTNIFTYISLLAIFLLVSIYLKMTDPKFDASAFGLFGVWINRLLNYNGRKIKRKHGKIRKKAH